MSNHVLLLLGQTGLRRRLTMAVHEALAQRIVVRYHMAPLTREECTGYVAHRLRLATAQTPLQFDELTSPYLRIEALRALRAQSTDATSHQESAAVSRGAYGRTPETTNSVEGMLV